MLILLFLIVHIFLQIFIVDVMQNNHYIRLVFPIQKFKNQVNIIYCFINYNYFKYERIYLNFEICIYNIIDFMSNYCVKNNTQVRPFN